MKRINKGEYGYIAYQRKVVIIRTVIFFAISAAIFITGYVVTGTRKNLLTIIAILGCLPACKSLVNLIMFAKAKGCSMVAHDEIENTIISSDKTSGVVAADPGLLCAYDLYMTSYDKNYAVSHIVICGNIVTVFSEDMDPDTARDCEKHIKEHLAIDGFKDMTIKMFTDLNKYTDRLKQLNELDGKGDYDAGAVLNTLIAISL